MDTTSVVEATRAGDPFLVKEREDREQPHACVDGWIFLGFTAHDDETGEECERIYRVPCRTCGVRVS